MAIESSCNVELAFTEAEEAAFRSLWIEEPHLQWELLHDTGNLRPATSSKVEDKDAIVKALGGIGTPADERDVALFRFLQKTVLKTFLRAQTSTKDAGADIESAKLALVASHLLLMEGEIAAAEETLFKAWNQIGDALGSQSPDAIDAMIRMGQLHHRIRNLPVADELLTAAVKEASQFLGPTHEVTLRAQTAAAGVLHSANNNTVAVALLKDLVGKATSTLGANHVITVTALNNLGVCLADTGDIVTGVDCLKGCLAVRAQTLGIAHPHTFQTAVNLVTLLSDRVGNNAAAEETVQAVLSRLVALRGEKDEKAQLLLRRRAILLRAQDRLEDAETVLKQCVALRVETCGPDHPSTKEVQEMLDDLQEERDLLGSVD